MPNLFETGDAAGSNSTTYTLGIGQTAQGVLGSGADHDWYRVNLVAGQTYTFAMVGTGAGIETDDPFLWLHDSAGNALASDDENGPDHNASLTYTATTSGTYYLDAGSWQDSYAGQYGLSAVVGTKAYFDEQMGAGALLTPDVSWSAPGTAANVTWAVRNSFALSDDADGSPAPFSQLSASEIASVRASLANYSEVGNISFTQVNPGGTSNSATMLFSNYSSATDGAGAYAYYPGDTSAASASGDVRLNVQSVSTTAQPRGSYSYFAIMHEIGHAVGLAHPGDYNATPGQSITYANQAQFRQDTHQYSVMSYFDETNTTTNFNSYPDTLMLFDILAIQQLYGANMTTRTGNTVYGFGSNAGAVYDFALNTDPVMSIWDAGGTDTINASGFSQAQRIDLNAGRFSNIGGFTANVSIAFGAIVENATGGSGADVLIGNGANNTINGGGGVDTMQGGAGHDTFYVDVAGDVVQEVVGEGSDRVFTSVSYTLVANSEIELLQTSNPTLTTAINLVGNGFGQTIIGNAGVNTLVGGGGDDVLRGLGGNDTYYVDSLSDVIDETVGQGTLDRVVASTSFTLAADDNIEFLATTNQAGTAAINLLGNAVSQTLVGNAGANVLYGGGGNDAMHGLGGDDTYYVDSQTDIIVEAAGQGTLDRVVASTSFTLAADDNIEFLATTNQAGTAAINLLGNAVSQTLVGNAGANVLFGGGGNDVLHGLGGNDTYYIDSQTDIIEEAAGGGTLDRVVASTSFALAADDDIEFLATTNQAGTTAINLTGNDLIQTIVGNAGTNILNGGSGSDTLLGLGGSDVFVFNTALDPSNVDTLSDFVVQDTIWLENLVFTQLAGLGALSVGQFISNIGGAATTAAQRIIYESDTGNLYYDSDGNAVGASVLFAHLNAGLVLTSSDFFIV